MGRIESLLTSRGLVLLAGLLAGSGLSCGGSTAPGPTPPPLVPPSPEEDPERAELERWNEVAREGAVSEEMHGVTVSDPYRSLEEESEGTTAWILAQTARSRARLDEWTDPQAAERLDELLSIGTIGQVRIAGERIFYTKRDGDREQPILLVRENGESRPLLDPVRYGERAALDWYYPSPSGEHVAFGISQNGDERSTLRVLKVDDGEVLEDTIERAKWSNVEWLHDDSAFYYTRYPKPGEDNYDAENEMSYFPRVFFHTIGSDPGEDPLVFGGENGTDFPGASVSADDRWVTVNVFRGWSESDVHLFDRGRAVRRRIGAPNAAQPLRPIVTGEPHLTTGRVHDGKLYLTTNDGSPRYRIDRVALSRAGDAGARQPLIAERDGAIEDWSFAGDKIVVHYIEDVQSAIRVFSLDGAEAGEISLPAPGSVEGIQGQAGNDRIAFAFSSYTVPPTLFAKGVNDGELETVDRIEVAMDFDRFRIERVRVPSADGTEIPVTLVGPRTIERNANQAVLLYGYGGFNISLLPNFTRNALYWIERGGIFAVANLRGGGEFGEAWHQAGMLGNKEHVFEDFEAVIRWMSSSALSNPERIAITGGSNGGLLMGAMLTRCPDAFRATASYVGLYDMVRYHQFPPAELWISEYGSADDADQFAWLHAYSPYHRIEDGTAYPAALIETADHDTRVYWGHSTKFAARLQSATSSDRPILFYMVESVGHGAGTRRSDLVQRYLRQYSFLEHELGLGG
ncbi:MAG: prolyl oligopeptidase family serine peptidase [Myxococcota bacterium]